MWCCVVLFSEYGGTSGSIFGRVPRPLIRYGEADDGCAGAGAGVEECKDEIASITARRLDEQSSISMRD